MGTQAQKINAKLRKRWAKLWALSEHTTLTTTEAVELLKRMRSFHMSCMEDALTTGDLDRIPFFEERIAATAKLIVDIEEELVQADIEIAKTIRKTPLLLAPKEQTDLAHAMGLDSLEVADA